MSELNRQGQQILGTLVEALPDVAQNKLETLVTYKQVHERLGLQLLGPTYGESLKHQGLSNLADWTESNRHPAIAGLIVDGTSFAPGGGSTDF
jgi:hypothetical protein